MGAATTFDGLKRAALKSPRALFTGAFCQFGFMPLVAYLLGLIADLDTALCVHGPCAAGRSASQFALHAYPPLQCRAISLVVVGSCPGGTTSQLFTYWANGDVAVRVHLHTLCGAAG